MVEMQSVALVGQKIKADGARIFYCAIGHIRGDEFRAHRQNVPPTLDPSFRITPVALGDVSDLRQCIGILRFRADNLHTEVLPLTAESAEDGEFDDLIPGVAIGYFILSRYSTFEAGLHVN